MKIAQLVCVFPPYRGGIGNVAKNFARLAKEHGHESVVITPDYGNSSPVTNDTNVLWLKPFLRHGNAAFLPQLVFLLKSFDFVFFHYPFFGADIFVWLAKLIFRKRFKLIIHYHMDVIGLPWYLMPLTWPSRLIFKSLVKNADLVTCASFEYLENSLVRGVYEEYKGKFREIPFGVDVEQFKPSDLPPNDSAIIFVGGLDSAHYFKGLDLLINTLANIKDQDWSLEIVGSGNLLARYEALVSSLGLQGRVKFLGDLNNISLANAYNRASFLVLSAINRNEAFGLVLLEALASGITVVASDLPGVRSVFRDKFEGLRFKTGDTKDLEEKIRWMLAHPADAKKMGELGRKLVLEKYDWRVVGEKLEEVVEIRN